MCARGRGQGVFSERIAQERQNLVKALDAVQDELERATANLASATGPIQTLKNKTDFDDNIRILTMELQTLGVSSNIVGEVESLCCRHLAKRELQAAPSKSTAGRILLDQREVV